MATHAASRGASEVAKCALSHSTARTCIGLVVAVFRTIIAPIDHMAVGMMTGFIYNTNMIR